MLVVTEIASCKKPSNEEVFRCSDVEWMSKKIIQSMSVSMRFLKGVRHRRISNKLVENLLCWELEKNRC